MNYGLFLISSHNTIRDKHEIVIQKKTFNKSINKTRNINQQTHNKTVLEEACLNYYIILFGLYVGDSVYI